MVSSNHNQRLDPAAGQFSLRGLLIAAFKNRLLIIVSAVSVPLIVLMAGLFSVPTFEVTSTLLVNKARAEIPLGPTDSTQLIVRHLSEEDLNSEIEILRSRQLIEEVLETLGVDESSRPVPGLVGQTKTSLKRLLGNTELSFFDATVVHLQERIEISAIRKSNVIRVSYRSPDAEWATRVVHVLTERYLERRAEMYQAPQAVSFFEEQMSAAGERLNEAERDLTTFLDQAGITMVKGPRDSDPLEAQKALVVNRLARLQNDLGDTEVEMQGLLHEISSLRARLNQEPERLQSSSSLNQDSSIDEIERALTALQLERDALLQEFKPDSRHVRDIDTQIELARVRLDEAQAKIGNIDGTEFNPTYQELKSELLRAEAQLEGTRARSVSLQQQADEYRRELDEVNRTAYEIGKLRRATRAAEDDYVLYRKKHEEARISAAMDQQQLINVTIAQPAQKPLRPIPRGLMMRLVAALFVGVVGGLGIAFVKEFHLSRSFTTGDEIERRMGLAHIASIPNEM